MWMQSRREEKRNLELLQLEEAVVLDMEGVCGHLVCLWAG
jgi:hypothetical protein